MSAPMANRVFYLTESMFRKNAHLMANSVLSRRVVVLDKWSDVIFFNSPFRGTGPATKMKPPIFLCETLVVRECSKFATFGWVQKEMFPMPKMNLVLWSSPVKDPAFFRFWNDDRIIVSNKATAAICPHNVEVWSHRQLVDMEKREWNMYPN